jgi:nitroimidazol reductase NimA-like FMN-containing flavoprotein (pyridoxamine 5'-phosphate oxidase superfamily)
MDDPRLSTERNVWLASVRPTGRPHLVPVWFVWTEGSFYFSTGAESVKGKNLRAKPLISLALEDGDKPLIAEGSAEIVATPYPENVVALFQRKYDWDVASAKENVLFAMTPTKWLRW